MRRAPTAPLGGLACAPAPGRAMVRSS
uniref:Uncharacterized protein n=1 Tax=Arundo donax TaxID=35708 RepID=A0A0A9FUT6_ARUDO